MKKLFCIFLLTLSLTTLKAKTTYIPTYRTYIHIVNDADTIVLSNNLKDLELQEKSGMFLITIEHEDITKEKVQAIKRAKRMAGWMNFSAIMAGVSTAFSSNSLQYMVRSQYSQMISQIADIYNENASAEQKLQIDMWIDNTSGEELMINDLERGLIWYVRPSESFHFQLNNPDILNLRISDTHNTKVRYAMVATGSLAKKRNIVFEDDICWISEIMKKNATYDYMEVDKYLWVSKTDFTAKEMSKEEYRAFIKEIK